jgi:hypothetical protein
VSYFSLFSLNIHAAAAAAAAVVAVAVVGALCNSVKSINFHFTIIIILLLSERARVCEVKRFS